MTALVALTLAAQLTSGGSDDLVLKIGDSAPPFSMRDLDRKMFSLANHTGPRATDDRKAVLLVFFATWCKPCKKEIPVIRKIHKQWKTKGVEVVYIGWSQSAKELTPFHSKERMPWRMVPDSFGLLSRRYGVNQLPHVFIIDKDGNVGFQHRGIAPDLKRTLASQLATITGEKMPADGDDEKEVVTPRFSKSMLMGRPPSGGGSAARWEPLAVYLGEAVEANLPIQSEKSYAAYEEALKSSKYDIANAGPLLCSRIKDLYEPVAQIERQGTPSYLGIIFAKRNSRIKKLKQLKGKTVGMVSDNSSSGGLYPRKKLLEAGLVAGVDFKIQWLGSHTKVAKAVEAGSVDAGACYEDCRDAVWKNARIKALVTRVIAYTEEIPAEMIMVKRSLDQKTKDAIKKALLALNVDSGILKQMSQGELAVTAISTATDGHLDAIAKSVAAVTNNPKNNGN